MDQLVAAFENARIVLNYPLIRRMSPPNFPAYETYGLIDGGIRIVLNEASQIYENYFRLRNLSQWQWSDERDPDYLMCVYYSTRRDLAQWEPLERDIWVSVHFNPSGVFVVSEDIRLATPEDVVALANYGV